MAEQRPADVKLTEKAGKNEAVVGTAAFYAPYVNFGHRTRGKGDVAANPFLTTAGEITKAKAKGAITAEQQIALKKEIGSSFDRQRKEGVEIIRYGDPSNAIEKATRKTLEKLSKGLATQAKRLCPNDTGYLRNSVMWKTEDDEGAFNVW